MNKQREVIYGERRKVLEGEDLKDDILGMVQNIIEKSVDMYTMQSKLPEEWDIAGLENYLGNLFLPKGALKIDDIEYLDKETLVEKLYNIGKENYKRKEKEIGQEMFREIERVILLQVVDSKWMDHIDAMDQLRQGIGLRAYGQEDPVIAYQIEGFDMFEEMNHSIQEDTIKYLYHVEAAEKMERKRVAQPIATDRKPQQPIVKGKKIGRNDPCPCGSGKKYKKCCGANK
jgi:preprotein translocase subunit SecA